MFAVLNSSNDAIHAIGKTEINFCLFSLFSMFSAVD